MTQGLRLLISTSFTVLVFSITVTLFPSSDAEEDMKIFILCFTSTGTRSHTLQHDRAVRVSMHARTP